MINFRCVVFPSSRRRFPVVAFCGHWMVAALVSATSVLASDARSNGSKVDRYVRRFLTRYDVDHSGGLESSEWTGLNGDLRTADKNQDGILTPEELAARMIEYGAGRRVRLYSPDPAPPNAADSASGQVPDSTTVVPSNDGKAAIAAENQPGTAEPSPKDVARRDTQYFVPNRLLPEGLPEWFHVRDANGDGQVSLAEFAPTGSEAGTTEFHSLDRNGDGMLTAREIVKSAAPKPTAKSPAKK